MARAKKNGIELRQELSSAIGEVAGLANELAAAPGSNPEHAHQASPVPAEPEDDLPLTVRLAPSGSSRPWTYAAAAEPLPPLAPPPNRPLPPVASHAHDRRTAGPQPILLWISLFLALIAVLAVVILGITHPH